MPKYLIQASYTAEGLKGLHNTRMQHSSPFQQEAAVGYLLGQGMFEPVGRFWEAVSLIEELGRLEVLQTAVEGRCRQLDDGAQQRQRDIHANNRGSLQEALGL